MTQKNLSERQLDELKRGLALFEEKTPQEKLAALQELGILDRDGEVLAGQVDDLTPRALEVMSGRQSVREQVLVGLKRGLERFEEKTDQEKLLVFQRIGVLDEHGEVTPEYADTFVRRSPERSGDVQPAQTLRAQQLAGLKRGLESFGRKPLQERVAVLQRLGILDERCEPTGRYAHSSEPGEDP